ncbi:hypothetical protein C8N26_0716 [Tenacibaculum lutimaris]|uniref:DUF5689 domain-containing protein n=1 Tax=Tenacibaculum lutimaris TaxID=285258 RepID=A0A420E5I0_9FLAO|nr:DUF5689 domain-containing protein [Tenacibaculum lutimaris]RKF05312.1 hypothetical protein C8N26_0716 [Tenacibaculum lutimaris]
MKTKNILKLIMLTVLAFTFNSCVEDGDFSIPSVNVEDPGLTATNTIQSVRDMLVYSNAVIDFEKTVGENLIIEGYVVSSDESGNIYKTISIQNSPENPTAAIQLAVDATDTYSFYEIGRKVYVKLNGLGLHSNNGVLEIGQLNGTSVDRISASSYKDIIIRSTETATITPLVLNSIADITDTHVNMLIQLNDMRSVEKNATYANTNNTYSVNRYFESCNDREQIIMRNSGFADFKAQSIPAKRGSIVAVLGKYRNDFQLFIRDTNDVMFSDDYDCYSNATEVTLADVKALYNNTEITITENSKIKVVITSDLSTDNLHALSAFAQDATAGIALRFSGDHNLNLGDEVEIAVGGAKLSEYNDLLQLNISPSSIISQTTGTLPTPEVITFAQALTGNYEGKLVQIDGVQFNDNAKTYSGNNELIAECDGTPLTAYVRNDASFANNSVSDKKGTVTGVMTVYKGTAQIYLRNETDVNFTEDATTCGGGGTPTPSGSLAFAGGNFEDFTAFTDGLNTYGLKSYATESAGNGVDGSTALSINMSSTGGNDYVFTSLAQNGLPSTYSSITFYVKGTSTGKSISINLYKTDGSYYPFNLGDITGDTTISVGGSNSYTGSINTGGEWVKITLDLSGITDLNTSNFNESFFALKVGKSAPFDLYLDNFTIQ